MDVALLIGIVFYFYFCKYKALLGTLFCLLCCTDHRMSDTFGLISSKFCTDGCKVSLENALPSLALHVFGCYSYIDRIMTLVM